MGFYEQRNLFNKKTRKYKMTEHSKYYYEKDRNINKESKTPSYYIGNEGMECIDVIHQFELSYDLGSACSYILRSKNKHNDFGEECITKAIVHLGYELRKIRKKKSQINNRYSGGQL